MGFVCWWPLAQRHLKDRTCLWRGHLINCLTYTNVALLILVSLSLLQPVQWVYPSQTNQAVQSGQDVHPLWQASAIKPSILYIKDSIKWMLTLYLWWEDFVDHTSWNRGLGANASHLGWGVVLACILLGHNDPFSGANLRDLSVLMNWCTALASMHPCLSELNHDDIIHNSIIWLPNSNDGQNAIGMQRRKGVANTQ